VWQDIAMHPPSLVTARLVILLSCCACAAPVAVRPAAAPVAPVRSRGMAVDVPTFPDRTFVVTAFGAKADGVTNDTPAINQAIETCNAAGGGTVTFPAGVYMAASIQLRSNVRLHLPAGAIIRGLKEGYLEPEENAFSQYQDFGHSHFRNALIWGEGLKNIAIEGEGAIEGGGISAGTPGKGGGDKQIALKDCERVLFRGIRQSRGGHFFYLLTGCRHVTMTKLEMTGGRDGIDLVGCSNVNVHDLSVLRCGDDTIALKSDYSTGKRLDSENVAVWNAVVESNCNGLQFGSETAGNFRNVTFSDIKVLKAGKAGIGLQSNDGGVIEDVTFENITIENAVNPIFINTTRRMRTPEQGQPGRIRNIRIRNVTVTALVEGREPNMHAATISGLPGVPHEDITLENVTITYKGGGQYSDGTAQPPYPTNYNPRALGVRPAYGFYIRHAKNLRFHNVKVAFQDVDLRPAWVASDVDTLELVGVSAQRAGEGAWPSLRLENVRNLRLQDSPQLEAQVAAAPPASP
jgi:polygalacturonase